MRRRGDCYHGVVESFFRTLKSDLDDQLIGSRDVTARVGRYIDGFYNSRRLHSTLNYQNPVDFEHSCRGAA